jgi:hypothetical protein
VGCRMLILERLSRLLAGRDSGAVVRDESSRDCAVRNEIRETTYQMADGYSWRRFSWRLLSFP